MSAGLARLADVVYRRRGWTVLAWIAVLIVIFPVTSALKGKFHADYATPGSDSETASSLIEQRFGGFSGSTVDVVWRAEGGVSSPATRQRVARFLTHASTLTGVGQPGPTRVSPDGKIAATSLELTRQPWDIPKQTGRELISLANKASGNGLEVKLGGGPIQDAEGGTGPEGIGFVGATVVLLIAFGSIVAVGLPLAVALFGLGVSSALIGLLAAVVDVPDWATAISSLMLIGVGVDYALLVLTRFRSALDDGKDTHDAVIEAVSTAGRSVLIAGSTVIIAMLGLFFVGLSYMHGVALAASIAVLTVMVAAITLLPALLGFAGRRVDSLRVPFLGRRRAPAAAGESPALRWSHVVQRHPWRFAIAATAVLLALAAPAVGMRLGFADAGNDPPGKMTRQAYDLNTQGFGPGSNGPLLIAAKLPARAAARKLDALVAAARQDPGVSLVTAPRVNQAGDAAIVTVIPMTGPQSAATDKLVTRLRDHTIPEALQNSGIQTFLGGSTATFADQSSYIAARLPVFFGGIIGLSFVLLLFAFHSPLISLKAGIMNLLSIGAAFGVMTVFAKGGSIGSLIGIDHAVPIAPFMPVIMFAILFGLSMDYEVFLVSRIREEFLRHGDTHRAIADGLAKTARVITAAAAIMVVVFLAFLTDNQVFLKLIGIGLATAIFVDATIVRMVLVPAVMQLLGSRNWWIPQWLERVLPRLDLEPAAASHSRA
ncbi:MAG: MMPL family transporter [Solirubrobacteraceae bacterium]